MPHRPTVARVDLDALTHNARLLQHVAPSAALCAVVKANAYGHGAVPVARALAAAGVPWFAVALIEEGAELRAAGITQPILALAGRFMESAPAAVELGLTPVVGRIADLRALSEAAGPKGMDVHIEVDTGMARLGVPRDKLGELLQALRGMPRLRLTGLMSHFACSEVAADFNHTQMERFAEAQSDVRAAGFAPTYFHMANSGGVITMAKAHHSLVRCGLTLYGVPPGPDAALEGLRPVMRWTTQPVLLRHIPKGAPVSYGCRWRAPHDALVATLPVGYADGYRRSFSNKAHVLVRGQRAPVVGAVCMDLCMVDVTHIAGVSDRDEVVLLGQQGPELVSAEQLAIWDQTIAYEILCGVGLRVPRQYVTSSA